ncbi:hypothetical protein BJY01DRAFT_250479 [Aspergillus pseudoustus]|uniref:Uncharacterized protein n=1 Tax=Aspergillus pseudoustus TaxID=1810923 RepID=A0ABR4JJT8_9EURO
MPYANISSGKTRQRGPRVQTFNSLVTYQNGNVVNHIDFAGRKCAFGIQIVGQSANCGIVAAPEPRRRRMPKHGMLSSGDEPLEEEPRLLRVQVIVPQERTTSRAMEEMLEKLCGFIGDLDRGVLPDLKLGSSS